MRTFEWIKATLRLPDQHESFDLDSWRRWLINILTILIVILGFPLSMAMVFPQFRAQGQTFLIGLDLLFFGLAVWHVLRRGRTFVGHPLYWVLAIYLLTISFHIAMGPQYARTGWLMLCAVTAAALYGAPAAFISTFSNGILLLVMYFSLGPHNPTWQTAWAAPTRVWFSYVVNITLLSLAVALPIGFVIEHLNRALLRERRAADELKEEMRARRKAQTALQEQERRYRMLAENASDVVWAMDLEGRFTYLSPSIERLSGIGPDALQNSRIHDFYGPDDLKRIESAIAEELAKPAAERRTSATMELRHRKPQGDFIDVEVSASWILDDAGQPAGIQGITRDISERKQAERRLSESRRLLAQSLDFLPDATFAIDTAGKVLFWNRAIERLTGVPAEEMVGRGGYAYAEPFYGERRPIMIDLVRTWDDEMANRYLYIKERDGLLISETVNPPFIKRPSVFWNAACRLYDEDGHDLGAIETIRDITEIRRAEKAVRESEYRFRSFFNSSPEGVVLVDLEGRIQSANKAFLQMSGYLFDDLGGRRFETIVPDAFQADLRNSFQSVVAGIIDDAPREFELHCKDGSVMPVAVRGWLITDEASQPVAVGGFVKDISKEKTLQEEKTELENQLIQTQKMEAVGTLAGGIAHDFNNLLGAIVGYTELARVDLPVENDTVDQHLRKVLSASGKATDLVKQILRFSRRESVTLSQLSLTPPVERRNEADSLDHSDPDHHRATFFRRDRHDHGRCHSDPPGGHEPVYQCLSRHADQWRRHDG